MGEVVQVAQDLVGRQVQGGQGLNRGSELAHRRCRADTVSHDVADHQSGAPSAQGMASNQSPPIFAVWLLLR
ncbi:hypothetical protein GCM10027590_35490 [Nocardiopsis nanhaiensis]